MTDDAWQPPRILSRQDWGAREPSRKIPTRPVGELRGTVVHHEAAEPRMDSDPAVLVRQVQNFHMDVRGWTDIAYNTLVWWDGTVLLGRDAGVVGAHTVAPGSENWNRTHLGVCILGNGDLDRYVTDDAWRAVLWAWSVSLYVTGGAAAGLLTHRETGSATHCAGEATQARMDSLRVFLANL